jgi:pimeloyl-ACP methyl ester carboxylesterase
MPIDARPDGCEIRKPEFLKMTMTRCHFIFQIRAVIATSQAFLLWVWLALVSFPHIADAARLTPLAACKNVPGAKCGSLVVEERRDAAGGRKIPISVIVVPTSSSTPEAPIFWFTGGPGEAATDEVSLAIDGPLAPFARERDVVFVDQRGTGGSNPLGCPLPQTPQGRFGHVLFDSATLAACRDHLQSHADLTQYVTSNAVDDIDDVRRWLGYQQIVLWGTSYGTRAAMEYVRRHGAHVAAVVLDGVYPFDAREPLRYAFDAEKALERVLADCDADPVCDAANPHVYATFAGLLDRFRNGPVPSRGSRGDPVPASHGRKLKQLQFVGTDLL